MNTEMSAESVARTAGNQAERCRSIDQRGRDLVHRAVSADRDNEFATLVDRGGREIAGVAGSFSDDDVSIMLCRKSADRRQRFLRASGTKIDDEACFQTQRRTA